MAALPASIAVLVALTAGASLQAQEAMITVKADQASHRLSRYLTGACIEDVNHEVYGGIDSQMIFGESFAEPPPPPPLGGFTCYGGRWIPKDGELLATGGHGPKLVRLQSFQAHSRDRGTRGAAQRPEYGGQPGTHYTPLGTLVTCHRQQHSETGLPSLLVHRAPV